MLSFIKKRRKKKWLIGLKIKTVQEIFQTKWIALMHEDGDYIVLPSWVARFLTVNRFVKYIAKGQLYSVTKNPY